MAITNQILGGSADALLRTDVLAQNALIELQKRLKLVPNTQRAFGGVLQGDKYVLPVITGGEASERLPGADVTDTANTASRVEIPVKEYEYSIPFDSSMYRGQPGGFARQFVINGTNKLARKVEQVGFSALAGDGDITGNFDSGSGLAYEDIQTIAKHLDDNEVAEDGRFIALNHTAKNAVLTEAEFLQYNVHGLQGAGPTLTGQSLDLYGFMPLFSNWLHGTAGATAALDGAVADGLVTTIPVDTLSVAGGIKIGDTVIVATEKMLVVNINNFTGGETIDNYTSADLIVLRGVLGTTAAAQSDGAAVTVQADKCGVAWQRQDVAHIFVDQEYPEGVRPNMIEKSRAVSPLGIELYVLKEHVPGTNGGVRFTMSTVFGAKATRPADSIARIALGA